MNKQNWEEEVRSGMHYTVPWLDLDAQAFRDFAESKGDKLPEPFGDDPARQMMTDGVAGKEVLCLASGGGQQSAVYGLLGARVTVLDLTEGQLEGDRKAAKHYGYEVTTVRGDMRDLSRLGEASFDLVDQAISICFVPEVRQVYREAARVLRPGGLYRVAHVNPATYPTCFDGPDNGWDGVGYRISEPYRGGPIRMSEDGVENMREGEMTGEFRHLLSDIFNGLVETGFSIRAVWEDRRSLRHASDAEPGSEKHRLTVIAAYLSVIAEK